MFFIHFWAVPADFGQQHVGHLELRFFRIWNIHRASIPLCLTTVVSKRLVPLDTSILSTLPHCYLRMLMPLVTEAKQNQEVKLSKSTAQMSLITVVFIKAQCGLCANNVDGFSQTIWPHPWEAIFDSFPEFPGVFKEKNGLTHVL